MAPYLRRVPVVVLAGQSNANGRGLVSDLPADHLGPYTDAEIFALGPLQLEPLEIGVNNLSLSAGPHHGPEVTLHPGMRNLLGEPVFLVKVAKDSTPIVPLPGALNDWSANPPDLAQTVLDVLDAMAVDLALRDCVPDVQVIDFQQGESDATVLASAQGYYAAQRALILFLREGIATRGFSTWRDVPFVMGRIHTDFSSVAPYIGLVNAAKDQVAAELRNVALFDTDDLAVISPDPLAPFVNGIHFDSDGQLELGLRFVRAWASIPREEPFPPVESLSIEFPEQASVTLEDLEPRYEHAASVLTPRGLVWTEARESNLRRLLGSLSTTWARLGLRAHELEREFQPRTATELLGEWEEALGLPGPCGELAPTLVLRRAAAAAKLAFRGGQNEGFFVELARSLGFEVQVVKYDGTTVDDTVDDFLASADWVFAFEIRAPKLTPFFFRVGSSVVGERLSDTNNALLECYIQDAKPAHTVVLFSYDLDVPVTTWVPWEFVRPEPAVLTLAAGIVTTNKSAPVP